MAGTGTYGATVIVDYTDGTQDTYVVIKWETEGSALLWLTQGQEATCIPLRNVRRFMVS